MKITKITATSVFVPYEAPVGPYKGRGAGEGTMGGSGLIVKVESDGLAGWGEGRFEFETDPADVLVGRDVFDVEGAVAAMFEAGIRPGPMSGVEMALWDLIGKQAGLPVHALWGGRLRERIDFTACQGIKSPSECAATAREVIERWGFTFLKTKAGDDLEHDIAAAAAIVKEIEGDAILRPDANGGYGPDRAAEAMARMRDVGVNDFEDPCSSDHTEVLRGIREDGTKVLVNEGADSPSAVRGILIAEAGDALMPDTPVAGSLLGVRKIAAVAEAWDVPCLMHCSHDLGLKTAAITHVAATTPNWSGPNDTCYHGLVDDILTEKLTIEGGQIAVLEGPGLGVEVDEGKVERYRQ